MRTAHDTRFNAELLSALAGSRANVRASAAETLAVLATSDVILRLQGLAEDGKLDLGVRQAALWTLGRSGRKSAAVVLLDRLADDQEAVRRAAADALADLTGEAYGLDMERWHAWWDRHRDLSNERWLELRVAYQAQRARRLEGDLERAGVNWSCCGNSSMAGFRLPTGSATSRRCPTRRSRRSGAGRRLVLDLLPAADALGQKAIADVLLRLSGDGSAEIQRTAVLALGRVGDPRRL